MTRPLLEYLEYRDYLRDCYEDRKRANPRYSLRMMGKRIGIDPGYLLHVMRKENHLSPRLAENACTYLAFTARESEYFMGLVGYARARNDAEARGFYERIQALRAPAVKALSDAQFEFYRDWRHAVVLASLEIAPFGERYGELGRRLSPPLSAARVRSSIVLLEKLGLAHRTESGNWERTHRSLSTGEQSTLLMREFHKEMIGQAANSLSRVPPEGRDVTSLTLHMRKETLDDVRQLLRQCRQAILQRVALDQEADMVFQANFQIFPLTQWDA
ncbi:MAG: hypothetical protein RL318_2527 [Fibrobacterota bacterium]|jgi:uncharacterized protein (TIGR02147 family)